MKELVPALDHEGIRVRVVFWMMQKHEGLNHGEDGSYVRLGEGAGAYRCNQSPQKMAVQNHPIKVFFIKIVQGFRK